MTLEEAERILNPETTIGAINEIKYYCGFNQEKAIAEVEKACEIGAKAIREKAEREKGCEYCNIPINSAYFVNYCPNCGRKLEKDGEDNE